MSVRWHRRRSSSGGIALVEALVSLTVAAMTLALLTSATWGLRQTTAQVSDLQEASTDWLTARRVLQSWSASATLTGRELTEGRFYGSPVRMQVILDDGTSNQSDPVMISLDISEEDGRFTLAASRFFNVRDIRLATDNSRASQVIVTDEPLRLIYRVQSGSGSGAQVWTYEVRPEQGLPLAVAVEQGDQKMIVARMPVSISAFCVSRLGQAGLEDADCDVR